MPMELDNLARFYRRNMENSTPLPKSLDHPVVYYLLVTFTVAGFFTVFARLIQFIRLMLSLFLLPGKPVIFSLPENAIPSD